MHLIVVAFCNVRILSRQRVREIMTSRAPQPLSFAAGLGDARVL